VRGRGDALRRCWGNGRLRRALTAYLLFNIYEWAAWIALMVWAYGVHGVRGASVVAMAQVIPAALSASAAAARLGRMRAPQALRLGYAVQAVTAAAVGVAMIIDAPFAVVCVLAAVASVGVTLTRPVHNALLPEISETTSELTAANAGSGWMESLAIFVGPLVSGALTAWWDPGGVLLVMAATSGVSVWCTLGLGPGAPRLLTSEDTSAESPLRTVAGDPAARLLSAFVAAEYMLLGTLDILLVVLALDQLEMSDAGPGILNSALGIGGMVGAAFTVVLIGAKRLAPALLTGAVVTGVATALTGISPGPAVAIVLLAVGGGSRLFFDVSLRTFVQRLLPDHLLSAVFGLQEASMMAGLAVGALVAPLLVAEAGTAGAFVIAGAFLPAVALAGWWKLSRLDASTAVPTDRLLLLQRVPMLAVLAPRVVERLAVFSGLEQHAARVAVVTEGETGDLFYVVTAGDVVVTHGADEIRRLGPGDWFGELALLHADARRTATVTTLGPVSLLTVDRRTFLTALAGTPRAAAAADDYARDHYR
jgi:MFS family permease